MRIANFSVATALLFETLASGCWMENYGGYNGEQKNDENENYDLESARCINDADFLLDPNRKWPNVPSYCHFGRSRDELKIRMSSARFSSAPGNNHLNQLGCFCWIKINGDSAQMEQKSQIKVSAHLSGNLQEYREQIGSAFNLYYDTFEMFINSGLKNMDAGQTWKGSEYQVAKISSGRSGFKIDMEQVQAEKMNNKYLHFVMYPTNQNGAAPQSCRMPEHCFDEVSVSVTSLRIENQE